MIDLYKEVVGNGAKGVGILYLFQVKLPGHLSIFILLEPPIKTDCLIHELFSTVTNNLNKRK